MFYLQGSLFIIYLKIGQTIKKMKNKKEIEKKYVDELKDEYDRIGEVRANIITVGCLVTVLLASTLIALKLGLIIIK